MRAMMLHGGGDIRAVAVPDPVPAPHEVVVKVHACSICGSDVHAFHGKHPRLVFPRILGHEFAGEIVDVGRDAAAKGLAAGQRVCCDIDIACGTCGPCRAGRGNICETLRTMGFDRDGGYAEFAAVPDYNIHPLPDSVGWDQASAVQVLGIGYHAVAHRVEPQPGEKVLVIGAGPIGLGAMLVARSLGARVASMDILAYRLAMARALGAEWTIDGARPDLRDAALELTGGHGFDRVVECVGGFQEKTVSAACSMVKRGGRITVVGTFPENRATIPIAYLKDREIDLNFSRGNFRAFPDCVRLIAEGRIDPGRYISHTFPVSRAAEALQLLEVRSVEAHKIVLHPQVWT
jgi:threonine dehydrogenase-like Zn-dependent dehydrogenase